jgi:hypothetical protein
VRADRVQVQHVGPDLGDQLLGVAARRDVLHGRPPLWHGQGGAVELAVGGEW